MSACLRFFLRSLKYTGGGGYADDTFGASVVVEVVVVLVEVVLVEVLVVVGRDGDGTSYLLDSNHDENVSLFFFLETEETHKERKRGSVNLHIHQRSQRR